jgi:hypothetical protein
MLAAHTKRLSVVIRQLSPWCVPGGEMTAPFKEGRFVRHVSDRAHTNQGHQDTSSKQQQTTIHVSLRKSRQNDIQLYDIILSILSLQS